MGMAQHTGYLAMDYMSTREKAIYERIVYFALTVNWLSLEPLTLYLVQRHKTFERKKNIS